MLSILGHPLINFIVGCFCLMIGIITYSADHSILHNVNLFFLSGVNIAVALCNYEKHLK